jgi:hypothetical protein
MGVYWSREKITEGGCADDGDRERMRSNRWLGALRCVCVITATIEKLRESDVRCTARGVQVGRKDWRGSLPDEWR